MVRKTPRLLVRIFTKLRTLTMSMEWMRFLIRRLAGNSLQFFFFFFFFFCFFFFWCLFCGCVFGLCLCCFFAVLDCSMGMVLMFLFFFFFFFFCFWTVLVGLCLS